MLTKFIVPAAALSALGLAKPFNPSPARTLDQLAVGTWLENIAVRPNGDLIATQMAPEALVYTIRNPTGKKTQLEEIASVPAIQSIFGIAQVPGLDEETFIFVGSNSTGIGAPVTGTFSAWKVTFTTDCDTKVEVEKISDMDKNSAFLNGVAAIPGVSDALLVADSTNGLVGRLDLASGAFDTTSFVFDEMLPVEGAGLPVGVNGIQVHNGYLYFDNSYQASIYRIPITDDGFLVEGATPELVVDLSSMASFLDDFAIDAKGNLFAASNFDNTVLYHSLNSGESRIVLGSPSELIAAGDTAVAFGRGKLDQNILYIATTGAIANPVNGTETEGAGVVALKIHV
ncbi:hypothetical protein B0I35DRAFT_364010 [Stachybotrys elegans]|uniref:SMP-30/Gluconolactonase/LRE-like region domain-containing protein n=1 Tax=Stachybotrys elegans TaxID=80388 RepID=A0A8K0SEI7_9HYPO|nr:hypothetical protein B0I35DRAFT_364010 [Stachybotrys elegans]